ncbi:MAG: winged helix-turn-helix transcriptional regulator [Woeseiaceae bacterium]
MRPTSKGMAAMLDLCGRRWALRVVWELRGEPLNFRALRDACGRISPSVLQRRLHELRGFGVIEAIPRLGYRLSARGEQLFPILAQLDKWAGSRPE